MLSWSSPAWVFGAWGSLIRIESEAETATAAERNWHGNINCYFTSSSYMYCSIYR